MKILSGKRVYLSLPIEFSKDDSWKHEVKDVLTNTFKLKVLDPTDDPKQQITEEIKECRKNRDFDRLHELSKIFVKKDLAIVDRADLIVAYVPSGVCTTGVVHEIINSSNAKKLTLLVEGTDKAKISIWYHGFIKHRFMFGSWNDLYKFLESINNGEYIKDDKLFFLYNYPDVWLS